MQNGVSSSFITASDGLRLHARCYGNRTASATPVVCLPGLARTTADFEALASALASCLASPADLQSMGVAGRERLLAQFSASRFQGTAAEIYGRLCKLSQ
jgi:hypothetical protein